MGNLSVVAVRDGVEQVFTPEVWRHMPSDKYGWEFVRHTEGEEADQAHEDVVVPKEVAAMFPTDTVTGDGTGNVLADIKEADQAPEDVVVEDLEAKMSVQQPQMSVTTTTTVSEPYSPAKKGGK